MGLLVRWRILVSPLLSKPFTLFQMKATYNIHSPLSSGTNIFKSPRLAKYFLQTRPAGNAKARKLGSALLMMKIEGWCKDRCEGRCNYPWMSSLAYRYLHSSFFISSPRCSTSVEWPISYIAHRNKTTVITSQISSIFPMAHTFKARERIMVTSVICYLRSQSGSNRVSLPPNPLWVDLIHYLTWIGSTFSVPLLLRIEVLLVSFYIWG